MARFRQDVLGLLLLFLAFQESNTNRVVSHEEVVSFEDQYLDFRFQENPDYAVKFGLRVYRNKTEQWNFEAFQRRLDKSKEFRETVMEMLSAEFEQDGDELSMLVLKDHLDTYIKGSNYKNYTVVLNQDITKIKSTLTKFDVSSMEDLENWHEKVKLYTTMIEDQLTLLTDNQYVNLHPVTKVAVADFLFRLNSQIQDDIHIPDFYACKPWVDMSGTISQDFRTEGLSTCRAFRAKLVELYDFLNNTYYPNTARDTIGLAALPGGTEAYEAALQFHTSPDGTAEEVHRIGLEEVERIGNLMNKISQDAGFGGVREYLDYLLNQTDETFATPELMTKGYEDMISQRIKPNIRKEFDFVPKIGLDVEDIGPLGGIGFYSSPRIDGSTPGVFKFDGSNPRSMLKVNMLSIAVHETMPGHHFQDTYAIESNLTHFRGLIEFAHYAQVPFNWPFYASEGWALYAESLAPQLGISVNSKEDLGRLGLESLRAARLVVDTGIHHYNWTMEQAEDYLYNHTTLSRSGCEQQVKRYIRWPGQACSYKFGQLQISALREKAEQELGESLNVAKYHDKLLSVGSLPLPLLKQEVEEWIKSQALNLNSANFNSMNACLMLSALFSLKFIF